MSSPSRLAQAAAPPPAAGTVVETASGAVRGTRVNGVLRFLGIPYGASTAGANRFRAPQPPEPWAGIRSADEPGPLAPQFQRVPPGATPEPVSEDCLIANVWTPGTGGARPVLLWIHGGGFIVGGALQPYTDGANLAGHGDVVVVSVHHRLGLLGFLNLDELGGPDWGAAPNASILDLIAALRWVHENVAAFGGDPDTVTIFGHSGGGGKVTAVMSSPQARGLFHRACVLGGPPFGFKVQAEATDTALRALQRLELTPQTARALQDLPVTRLLEIQGELGAGATPGPHGMRFAPTVGTESVPAFPVESFASGVSSDIPLLIGTALDEMRYGMLMNAGWRDPGFEIDETTLVAAVASGIDNADQVAPLIERYRALTPDASRFSLMLDILSDQFRIRTLRLADAKVRGGSAPVHVYLCALHQDTPMRAFHGTELPLLFHNVDRSQRHPATDAARRGERALSDALVSFARDGVPSPSEGWPPYTPDTGIALAVTDVQVAPAARPYPERLAVWDGVITSVRTDPWGVAFS